MVLIIQEMTDQLIDVRVQIKETHGKMSKDYPDKTVSEALIVECDQYKDKLENELTIVKKKKFIRDADDYEKDNVYLWRSSNPRRGNNRRSIQRGDSTAADTDSDAYSSASTASSLNDVTSLKG